MPMFNYKDLGGETYPPVKISDKWRVLNCVRQAKGIRASLARGVYSGRKALIDVTKVRRSKEFWTIAGLMSDGSASAYPLDS